MTVQTKCHHIFLAQSLIYFLHSNVLQELKLFGTPSRGYWVQNTWQLFNANADVA